MVIFIYLCGIHMLKIDFSQAGLPIHHGSAWGEGKQDGMCMEWEWPWRMQGDGVRLAWLYTYNQ